MQTINLNMCLAKNKKNKLKHDKIENFIYNNLKLIEILLDVYILFFEDITKNIFSIDILSKEKEEILSTSDFYFLISLIIYVDTHFEQTLNTIIGLFDSNKGKLYNKKTNKYKKNRNCYELTNELDELKKEIENLDPIAN